MPMPMPNDGEMDDAFMDRCMGDSMMNSDYPESDQRAAVCRRQMEGKPSEASALGPNLIGLRSPARIEAAQPDKKTPRSFSMRAYNGGELRVGGWEYPVVIDLSGLAGTGKDRPILRDHNPTQIVGHGRAKRSEDLQPTLDALGAISGAGPHAQEVLANHDNGFPWQTSVGVDVTKAILVGEEKTVTVNGREFTGPIIVARKSQLREISFVALGADENTSASIAASAASTKKVEVLTMEFAQWLEAQGLADYDTQSEPVKKIVRAKYDAEQKPIAPPPPIEAAKPVPAAPTVESGVTDYRKAIAAESTRIATVRRITAGYPEIEAQAIAEGWDETKTELNVLRAGRPKAPAGHVADNRIDGKVLEASLCRSAGLPPAKIEKWFDPKTLEAADKFRRISIPRLFEHVIRAAGMDIPMSFDSDAIRAAFRASRKLEAEAAFSSISLPGILGATANKVLLDAYQMYPGVATQLSATVNAKDFKSFTSYMLTMTGEFEQIGASGELKHASLEEESYSNQVKTRGKMIALTREMIINDDLAAFLQIPRMLGRKAAEALEKAWFTAFLDAAGTFYTSGHNNLNTSCALSITNLGTAEKAFINQTDSDGMPVLVMPTIILVPPSLKVTADSIYTDIEVDNVVRKPITADATGSVTKETRGNPFKGRFRPLFSPWLEVTSLINYSATTWYLLAEPGDVPAMQIAYLNGQQTPVIEQGDVDFNVLGAQWRAYSDFGVATADYRAASKNTA